MRMGYISMSKYFNIKDKKEADEMEDEYEDEEEDEKPKRKFRKKAWADDTFTEFLDWVAEHRVFTVIILILIIMGFGKIARHFGKRYDKFLA